MIEIFVTIIIVSFAGFVIVKSLRNSSKGKCNCGCDSCKTKKLCSDKNNSSEK